jgi:transcriptional regulator with GAF, ATPase, and Fis domain
MMSNKSSEGLQRFEELIEYLEKGKLFTQELMKENERLRLRSLQLEKEKLELQAIVNPERLGRITDENHQLRLRLETLEARFAEIAKENQDFAQRYLEVQSQNDNLVNLYVASYQLHSTLDPQEVVTVIQEIILNLIGAEEYGIYMVDAKKGNPLLIAGEGPDGPLQSRLLEAMDPVLAQVLRDSKKHFSSNGSADSPHLACIPLRVKDDVVGALSITKLMDQKKEGFTTIDHELLELLADHAATALVSANLYSRTERKLRTVESFIEMLKLTQPQLEK